MPEETTISGTATESQTTQTAGTEAAKTFTQEEVNRILAKELKPYKESKTAYEKILEEQQQKKDAELTEVQRLQKRVEELTPYETQAKEYETDLKSIVDARTALVPADKLSLVPTGYSPAQLLKWYDANDKLLFGTERPAAPEGTKPITGEVDVLQSQAEAMLAETGLTKENPLWKHTLNMTVEQLRTQAR